MRRPYTTGVVTLKITKALYISKENPDFFEHK
jgi:hypothetical protein